MSRSTCLLLVGACLASTHLPAAQEPSPASAQSDAAVTLSSEVERFLHATLGTWRSQTTIFDRDGNVVQELTGGFVEEVLIENHLNLHSSHNADGSVNKAFRFYSPGEDRVYLIDVTAQGQWWVVSGKPGADVMTSEEKLLADGRRAILKFTHFNIREDAFEAISEVSFDDGETWRKISHQDYKRVSSRPDADLL